MFKARIKDSLTHTMATHLGHQDESKSKQIYQYVSVVCETHHMGSLPKISILVPQAGLLV